MKSKKPKILLLHGWSWQLYNSQCDGGVSAWPNSFLKGLSDEFEVLTLTFPGFLGNPEPKSNSWALEDYASYLNDFLEENCGVDYVLGFSFGGAVALKAKEDFGLNQSIVLISPAISRRTSNRVVRRPKILKLIPTFFVDFVRDLYLVYVVKNSYYKYGSRFIRNSYREIVVRDIKDSLGSVEAKDVTLIFGDSDTATPLANIKSMVKGLGLRERLHVFKGAGHRVFESHESQVLNCIKSTLKR